MMGVLRQCPGLETSWSQYFHCLGSSLGLEGYCLGLCLSLDRHCLGLSLGFAVTVFLVFCLKTKTVQDIWQLMGCIIDNSLPFQ